MRRIAVTIILVLGTGCVSVGVNRTRCAKLWDPLEYGQEYQLAEDVFLMALDDRPSQLALVPSKQSRLAGNNCYERSAFYSAPETVDAYLASPCSPDYSDVAGIVCAETQLELLKLERFYQFSLWFGFAKDKKRYAVLRSGQFKGRTVDIEDLCWKPGHYLKRQ